MLPEWIDEPILGTILATLPTNLVVSIHASGWPPYLLR